MRTAHHLLSGIRRWPLAILIPLLTAISVQAQNTAGCNAQFTYQQAPGSMTISFAPLATVAAAQYSWNFGDGSLPVNFATPQHLYLQPGAYQVCLTVTSWLSNGTQCTAQWCDSVHIGNVSSLCNAQFTWSAVSGTNSIQFSPALNGLAAQYAWSFGDGGTSNQLNPSHVYPGPGAYQVCLTVTNGTCVNTFCDSVHVTSNTVNCDAHFSATTTTANAGTFYFQPVMNTVGTRYQWTFGDGASDTSRTPYHTYSQPGVYWACLTVTRYTAAATVACTATWCDSIHVITNNTTVCDAHFTHQFAQTSNAVYFNPANNPAGTTYSWSFGDGGTSTMRTPTHVYTQPGAYLVCLDVTVTGVNGGVVCTSSWCDSVIITQVPNPCSARFAWSVNNAIQTASFRPQTTSPGTVYSWNFGDGATSSVMNPAHQYASPGVYWVCLTITRTASNTGGTCSDTWCDSVRVNAPLPPNCNAAFNFYRQFNQPFTYRFLPMTMAPGTSYYWTFGDGDTSTLRTPVHSYADTGIYQVCLTVVTVNSAGSCSSTVCRTILVRPLQPFNTACGAFFTMQRVQGIPGLFQFTSFASGGNLTFQWTFGDSTSSNLPNPVHQYTTPGAYTICLSVRDTVTNCRSRICRLLVLGPNLMPVSGDFQEGEELERLMDVTSTTAEVFVYPNPADEFVSFQLKGIHGTASLQVTDATGREVLSRKELAEGTFELPVSGFSSGIYFYRIDDSSHSTLTGRFIVR